MAQNFQEKTAVGGLVVCEKFTFANLYEKRIYPL